MRTKTHFAWTVAALIATASLFTPRPGTAQTDNQAWPQRTVRFIVPFGPGSAADTAGRLLAERLQKVWGKPVIVENRPGGDGLVSIGAFVSAKDDHTLFLTPTTVFLVHPYTRGNLPYDVNRDFKPISLIGNIPLGIAVTASLPVTTLKEFVDYAKREAGKVNYGISGGFLEFVWDGFRRENAVPMVKVPFRDIVQAPIDLGEGRISVLMTSVTTHRPMLQAGKTKLLAICDPQRSEIAPGVPTVIEAGFPGLLARSLNVLFGPSHMPLQLRQRVSNDIAAALKENDILDKLRTSGQQVVGGGPDALAEALAEQNEQVARIAKVLGIVRKK
jgi:tripartite-type tricarboxylate transporter receptor subunit TctC